MARLPLIGSFALLLGGCASTPHPMPQGRPSILLILVDCLRADHVGAYGYERPATPSIDALAAEGTVFLNAFAQASWTRPSVPSLLTGLYPSEHGLGSFEQSADQGVEAASLSPEVLTLPEVMRAAGYRTAMLGEQYQLAPQFGLSRGFDYYRYLLSKATGINERFLEWLDGSPAERPFFVYLHYLDIHWPYCPPPTTRGAFGPQATFRLCQDWRELREDINSGRRAISEADRRAIEARYDEELYALDAHLGELFRALQQRGLWDELLVVLTSDHGEEFLERGMVGHGQSLHDELIAVPLIVKPPAGWSSPRGGRVEGLVELRSLMPTLVEAVGVRTSTPQAAPSLLPWLRQQPPPDGPSSHVVAEANGMLALRTRQWKLIVHAADARFELYDLVSDPRETHDLSGEQPQQLERMLAGIEQWRRSLRPAEARATEFVDEETVRGLEALGYLE